MGKEKFRDKRFSWKNHQLLVQISGILSEFAEKNIKVTLRQLYYQLVSRGIIPNKVQEYTKLSTLLRDARYCGLVSWDAIEDRMRTPKMHSQFTGVRDLIEAAKWSYRLDRWEGQKYYVELWTEKDALTSVLAPIADKWHIYFCVNRGYSSATAMYDSSKRILRETADGQKQGVILYLGDHDPSGLDMVRDIEERLKEFQCFGLKVQHVALTTEQIEEYDPPPNPAKLTDPRASSYIAEHGDESWEVDALRPDVMLAWVNGSLSALVDLTKMEQVIEKEKRDMKQLAKLAEDIT